MFDMPPLTGRDAIIIPSEYETRRHIVLLNEYKDATLKLEGAPKGVTLDGKLLTIRSSVAFSATFKVKAEIAGSCDYLPIEVIKDETLRDTPRSPREKEGWTLFYEEDFDGNDIDPEFWSPYYLRGWSNDEMAKAEYSVRDGYLGISCSEGRANWSAKDGEHRVSSIQTFERRHLHRFGEVTGARNIATFDGLATKYGYFEIRARFPDTGDGSHFAWWMIGVQDDQHESATVNGVEYPIGDWSNQTAEFDVIEQTLDRDCLDLDIDIWRPVLHPNGTRDIQYLWVPPVKIEMSAAHEFHTYGLEWDENGTKFYLDGNLTAVTDRTPTYRMMTLFSVYGGVRGKKYGYGTDRGIYPKEVLIDYFRIWKRDIPKKPCSVRFSEWAHPEYLHIPEKGRSLACEVYSETDELLDDLVVTWSLSSDIGGRESAIVKGASIDPKSGVISVSEDAKEDTDIFVSALTDNGHRGVKHIKLSKATPYPSYLMFKDKTVRAKAGDEIMLNAVMFNQYGEETASTIVYQISEDLTGNAIKDVPFLKLNGDRLMISDDAVSGKYVITAFCGEFVAHTLIVLGE